MSLTMNATHLSGSEKPRVSERQNFIALATRVPLQENPHALNRVAVRRRLTKSQLSENLQE